MSTKLLLIFTRNPELGKCKTRLAATIGDNAALDVYKFLLKHTVTVTCNLNIEKHLYYSNEIWNNDIWDSAIYTKKLQEGANLGERMLHAFEVGFNAGFDEICIIGSDLYDISEQDFTDAFDQFKTNDFVIGPALDGGYYLLGMRKLKKELFSNKNWGTNTVLKDTLADLAQESVAILAEKNDVDYYEDIKDIPAFAPFLKHLHK